MHEPESELVQSFEPLPLEELLSPVIAGVRSAQLRLRIDDDSAIDQLSPFLHPDELALVSDMMAARKLSFLAGRAAMRRALLGTPLTSSTAVLRTERGAPALPAGMTGSISHKSSIAVAIVAPTRAAGGSVSTIGIDIEERPRADRLHRDIARRILTPNEMRTLPSGAGHERQEVVLLHFALKEAVYKAIDPLVQRHVHFGEVELTSREPFDAMNGVATVHLLLPEFAHGAPVVECRWMRTEDHLYAIAWT